MEKTTTCAFTGHRENKLPWRGDESDARCLRLKQQIYDAAEAVYCGGIRHYICGMANGCDFYFAAARGASGGHAGGGDPLRGAGEPLDGGAAAAL